MYGVNTPSRWGCSPVTTKVFTPDGWKGVDELSIGDTIFTWVAGTMKEAKLKHIIRHKNDYGVLHQYRGHNYVQTVTPDHRCIIEVGTGRGIYAIKQSMDVFKSRRDLRMPASIDDVVLSDVDTSMSDAEVMLAAIYYADGTENMSRAMEITKSPLRDDGTIKKVLDEIGLTYTTHNYGNTGGQNVNRYMISSKHKDYMEALIGGKRCIDKKFLRLSKEQSEIFIRTWAGFDGSLKGRISCQYDNKEIGDALEIIMLRAGYLSHRWSRKKAADKNVTNYIYADRRTSAVILEQEEIEYSGEVWCPNTEDGTAIFKDKDGNIFISGNCQAPFSNITLDWVVPNDMKNLPAIVGGKEMDFTYGDCKKEMDMVNKAFIEIMIEGDANGRGFQYPIPTYSITRDFDWSETENNKLLFEMTAKYGTPYFSNYVNSDMEPSDVRSMCCRLRLDLRELRKKSGGFFGSGESTGSIGVVTINMPRIGYLSENEEDFFNRLDHLMDIAARSLKTKRTVITKLMDQGLYPYTRRYLGTFDNHFSTIGLVGMNEACLNAKWLREDLTHEKAQAFTEKVLNHMRERLSDYQEKYGDLYNLEATPAESTTYRFAKHDREQFPDIITANMNGAPYYTNSSHLPVGFTEDVFSALDIQDKLQTLYTSGTVFHAFLGEKLPSWQSAAKLVRKIAENYKLPYYTMSPTYSVCAEHGYLTGEQGKCPYCGKKTEIYSRITGYYRPVQNWNDGKAQEFKDRREYVLSGNFRMDTLSSMMPEKPADRPVIQPTAAKTLETAPAKPEADGSKVLLFKTTTCPNCRNAEALFAKAGIKYKPVNADDDESADLVEKFGIRQAPTLVVTDDEGNATAYRGLSDICGWLKENTH